MDRHFGRSSSTRWSRAKYARLVEYGRAFAEEVLIHLERLEKLDENSDPRDLDDANIYLESALLDFQDAQVEYTGRGFEFVEDSDGAQAHDSGTRTPAAGQSSADNYGSPEASTSQTDLPDGHIVSVMTRHDFELTDPAAVEEAAQEFATMAGATPVPEGDIGYAMAILNYMGLAQLTTTPGLQPLLEVNAISTRPDSPDKARIDRARGVEEFFEAGHVLNSQTNLWDPAAADGGGTSGAPGSRG